MMDSGFAAKVRSEAPKVRRDGSQGQGRSEAEHAAPGYPTKQGRALKRAIDTRSVTIAVGPSGLKPSNFIPSGNALRARHWLPYLRAFGAHFRAFGAHFPRFGAHFPRLRRLLWTFEA